jgi:hypothetical protein
MEELESRPDPGDLALKLSAIPDVKQRSHVLARSLAALQDENVVYLVKIIKERALMGDGDYLKVYNGLLCAGVLAEVMGHDRMTELARIAKRNGEHDVVCIFVDAPPDRLSDCGAQPFLDVDLRDKPLGMRKALARKPDFNMLRRIARDQDHRVIGNLLNNSKLTESDVIRIAATRPTSPRVIEEIFNHPRWIARHSVKKAIVLNPYSPLSISLRLITYMRLQELAEICASGELGPRLHDEARRLIQAKRRCTLGEDDSCLSDEYRDEPESGADQA